MTALKPLNKPLLILIIVALTLIAGAVLRAHNNVPTSPPTGSVSSGGGPAFPVAAIGSPKALP